ncbi:beta-galactosidase [Actinoplanes couchii]|uniref:Beta-galactosidase n=1 Tax=Actinoplanes couchii TaxID=403638 RepID=A0ABQ3XP04_9ACTN|nr:beta-galactosidase [Actinoplanes couchii]MDR6318641.1 beta-galactosidase [Actinoplanes couchii]GID60249.1 beta-galactosidase [Actinoplanes couchii]
MRDVFSSTPWYGGDYNPEQWPEQVWDDDVRLMNRAGVNLATVGVFSWSRLEPREGEYDFAWLDHVLDTLHAGEIRVDLATATASPPPWFSRTYPESLPVTADGTRLHPGSRQAYCPSSVAYRTAAARLVRALAERYGRHPALVLWHVNNEYGCHVARCWCDASADAFRQWLRDRYQDIDTLNEAWGTAFWSQRYDSFDEILPPRATPAAPNPTQHLDFDRFSSDELLACYLAEKRILREITPDIPVTTNFMGTFRGADYWKWAPHLDVISDDLYPDPADPDAARTAALARDLMRSLGRGRPWLLMEQSAGAVNWRPSNAPKAPGQMRALSYQAMARGADGILFFQWRQSRKGAEAFHSAMLPHSGTDTRIFREIEELGRELRGLGRVVGTTSTARAALVFDWDSWWAVEQRALPVQSNYLALVAPWHAALTEAGVLVDLVHGDEDLTGYSLVVAPSLFVATDAQIDALDTAARSGATVVVTAQSAILDETLAVRLGGYLGGLQQTLGVWIEEFAPLGGAWQRPGAIPVRDETTRPRTVALTGPVFPDGATGIEWSEVVRPHDAEVRARFTGGPLDGLPALTRRATGPGAAWYLATRLGADDLAVLAGALIEEAGLVTSPVHRGEAHGWVETVRRGDLTFVINHGTAPVDLDLPGVDLLTGHPAGGLRLDPQGVAVVAAA